MVGPLGQHVELDRDGVAVVDVLVVAAVPAERAGALADLQPAHVDAAVGVQRREKIVRAVLAYHAHQSHRREKAAGVGEVDARSAQGVLDFARGRFDRVDADAAGYKQAHANSFC